MLSGDNCVAATLPPFLLKFRLKFPAENFLATRTEQKHKPSGVAGFLERFRRHRPQHQDFVANLDAPESDWTNLGMGGSKPRMRSRASCWDEKRT